MATEHQITIPKTARYYQIGRITEHTRMIWFVLHGYSQLAKFFIRKFEPLDDGEHVIIAPEGLHRFYREGYSGKVGASWMTKEDRETDIRDYVRYLDLLYERFAPALNDNISINVLGFSQGSATASRWVCQGEVSPNNFILWCGVFPPDLDFEVDKQRFERMNNIMVFGKHDEFTSPAQVEDHQKEMGSKGIEYDLLWFDGGHDIDGAVLSGLFGPEPHQ